MSCEVALTRNNFCLRHSDPLHLSNHRPSVQWAHVRCIQYGVCVIVEEKGAAGSAGEGQDIIYFWFVPAHLLVYHSAFLRIRRFDGKSLNIPPNSGGG